MRSIGGAVAYIGMGANLGDRLGTLREATKRIGQLGRITAISSVYETAPVGYADQPAFLNMALGCETDLDAASLMQTLLAIEQELGRVRSFRNAPRTLDLDLLLYGDRIIDTPTLTVPHPRMGERAFVLVPLAEIAPDMINPSSGKTLTALKDALGEFEGIQVFAPPFDVIAGS
jgi:2-amino-4-hydroxy-6-hydroxymethyldihydropteridine diphosphokinase